MQNNFTVWCNEHEEVGLGYVVLKSELRLKEIQVGRPQFVNNTPVVRQKLGVFSSGKIEPESVVDPTILHVKI